jgi:hypothetical protein
MACRRSLVRQKHGMSRAAPLLIPNSRKQQILSKEFTVARSVIDSNFQAVDFKQ